MNGADAIQEASNLLIITGPSRTANIGLELAPSTHWPRHLAVILTG